LGIKKSIDERQPNFLGKEEKKRDKWITRGERGSVYSRPCFTTRVGRVREIPEIMEKILRGEP